MIPYDRAVGETDILELISFYARERLGKDPTSETISPVDADRALVVANPGGFASDHARQVQADHWINRWRQVNNRFIPFIIPSYRRTRT